MKYEDAVTQVYDLLNSLEGEMKEWQPLQTAADERAYDLLGRIYEEAALIDADRLKRTVLEDILRGHAEVGTSKKWSPAGKATSELLVTRLLGLKTSRTRKHNWVCALAYASDCQVKPARKTFQKWISSAEVGGIEGAVAAYRGEVTKPEEIDLLEAAAALAATIETPKMVELQIANTAPAGLAVFVVQRQDDGTVAVLKESTDEGELKRVFADLHITKKKRKAWTAMQVANIERDALGRLTPMVIKTAEKKLPSVKDGVAFMGALKRLSDVPQLREKYFTDEPHSPINFNDMGKYAQLPTINEQFHPLDPARYIAGGRERVLIPYPFDPNNEAENKRQITAYLEGLKRPRRKKPEPRTDGPTLDTFLDYDEAEHSDQIAEVDA